MANGRSDAPPTLRSNGGEASLAFGLDPVPEVRERRAWLDIRLQGGPSERRVVTASRLVIGRSSSAELRLDHHTVSRRHAELFGDPFGRFWIRDLRSTNGTLVNDEAVAERVLKPGDVVSLGDFTLVFGATGAVEAPDSVGAAPPSEDRPTVIRTLFDFAPPRLSAAHLRTMLDLGRRLSNLAEVSERWAALCDLATRSDFHGSLALVLRMAHRDAEPTLLSGTHQPVGVSAVEAPYLSRRTILSVFETGEPVLAGNASRSTLGAVDLTLSPEIAPLWVVACPLGRGAEGLDLLYVILPPGCGSAEWLALFALAAEVFRHAESAWAARRHAAAHAVIEHDLTTARQIQRALLPRKLAYPGVELDLGFEPCRWVGGDYVDVVPLVDGRLLLAVADVCGKGLQAALVTSSLHTIVRAGLESSREAPVDLAALVDRINRHLTAFLPSHSFVTLVMTALDPTTGALEHVNAGHPPAIVLRDGSSCLLPSDVNPPLGIGPFAVEAQHAELLPGDVMALYTDGLTEQTNEAHEMLGVERLALELGQAARRAGESGSVRAMAASIDAALRAFRGERLPEDDCAFLLARRA